MSSDKAVLVLSGGVGGAKLVWGLAQEMDGKDLNIVVNTADDFEHLGMYISPDADTVLYTLAGLANEKNGWGRANESWRVLETLKDLGGAAWFKLGDLDLATHLYRSARLREGATLSRVYAELAKRWGIKPTVLPMSEQQVRTFMVVRNESGGEERIAFQEYFVHRQCAPALVSVEFEKAEDAAPNPEMMRLLQEEQISAVIIAPSNPIVSINPILSFSQVRSALCALQVPVVAVSPIVGGAALKGPLAKMLGELGLIPSTETIANYYSDFLDGFIIDETDSHAKDHLKMPVCVAPTIMSSAERKIALARTTLEFCSQLAAG
jgi:LPPG:FO 2-phospho-L-lactate transferase